MGTHPIFESDFDCLTETMRLFGLLTFLIGSSVAELVNERVSRVLDASTQLLRSSASVVVRNDGDDAVSVIQLAADAVNVNRLIYLTAKLNNKKLNIDKDFKITLDTPLKKDEKVTLEIDEIYHGAIRAFPSEIKQSDNQLVVVEINLYYSTPYKTIIQNSRMNIGTKKTESFSKQGKLDGQAVKFNEQSDSAGGSIQKVRVHFENNSPFLVAEKVEREIEISHWGNIAVTDKIWVKHNGASLKGPFSRFDFQRQDSGPYITEWKMTLPLEATDVYYRDLIGNISTSHLRADFSNGESVLELTPRFPMMGGWRNHYTIGYNMPTANALSQNGQKYRFKNALVPDLYENYIVEDLELKFILPEGVENLKFNSNIDLTRENDDSRYTFLDTTGRVVVTLKGPKIVADAQASVTLTYEWNSMLIFKEPHLAISGWLVFFFLALFIGRLDFSIATPDTKKKQ